MTNPEIYSRNSSRGGGTMKEPGLGGWLERPYTVARHSLCQGHELPIVHDMVKWITGSVVRREFRDHKPFWGLVTDDVKVEKRGKHVIQSPIDRVGRTPTNQIPHWLLYWQMKEPICHDRCS